VKKVMKKIIKWGLIGIVVLIVIVAVSSGGGKSNTSQQNKPENQEATQKTEEKEEQQSQTALKISTNNFIKDFDDNQLAAEEKYKDKLIEFSAVIQNISEDIVGTPFLSLKPTADEFYMGTTIKCNFNDKSELTSVKNGQSVVLQGTVDTQSLGIISVKDCKIISEGQ